MSQQNVMKIIEALQLLFKCVKLNSVLCIQYVQGYLTEDH